MVKSLKDRKKIWMFSLGLWLILAKICQGNPIETKFEAVRAPAMNFAPQIEYNEDNRLLRETEVEQGAQMPPMCPQNIWENFYPCSNQRLIVDFTNVIASALLVGSVIHLCYSKDKELLSAILGLSGIVAGISYPAITYAYWWAKIPDRKWIDLAIPAVGLVTTISMLIILPNL